jgi:WD40 repeat protein
LEQQHWSSVENPYWSSQAVRSVAFDTTYLIASGSFDKTIKIWNKNYGDLLWTLTGHDNLVKSVAFDSTFLLASGSYDKTIKIWDKIYGSLLRTLTGHGESVEAVAEPA